MSTKRKVFYADVCLPMQKKIKTYKFSNDLQKALNLERSNQNIEVWEEKLKGALICVPYGHYYVRSYNPNDKGIPVMRVAQIKCIRSEKFQKQVKHSEITRSQFVLEESYISNTNNSLKFLLHDHKSISQKIIKADFA